MKSKESEEMYLETILLLEKEKGSVISHDIVDKLNYAKSSVSRGVNLLKEKGYVIIDSNTGKINFTVSGKERARNVYERHQTFTKLFVSFGANKDLAEDNACRVEHVISDEMYQIIKNHFKDEID